MPKHLKYQPEECMIHHVTSRCWNGCLFLKPTPEITSLILGVLEYGRAAHKDGILIHNFVVMSNHYHLLLSSRTADDRKDFMRFFNKHISEEVNRVLGKKGTLWDNPYSSHVILDEVALEQTYKYIFANTYKERLVEHPSDWPGFHGFHVLGEKREVEGVWYDRTTFYNKSRLKSGKDLTLEDFKTTYKIQFDRPLMWKELDDHAFHKKMCQFMDDVLEEWAPEEEESVLGAEHVLEQKVYQFRRPKAGKSPLCQAGCAQLWKNFRDAYRTFKKEYQEANQALSRALRGGKSVHSILFPKGGILPVPYCRLLESAS